MSAQSLSSSSSSGQFDSLFGHYSPSDSSLLRSMSSTSLTSSSMYSGVSDTGSRSMPSSSQTSLSSPASVASPSNAVFSLLKTSKSKAPSGQQSPNKKSRPGRLSECVIFFVLTRLLAKLTRFLPVASTASTCARWWSRIRRCLKTLLLSNCETLVPCLGDDLFSYLLRQRRRT
jgi:hypothetical protein